MLEDEDFNPVVPLLTERDNDLLLHLIDRAPAILRLVEFLDEAEANGLSILAFDERERDALDTFVAPHVSSVLFEMIAAFSMKMLRASLKA